MPPYNKSNTHIMQVLHQTHQTKRGFVVLELAENIHVAACGVSLHPRQNFRQYGKQTLIKTQLDW